MAQSNQLVRAAPAWGSTRMIRKEFFSTQSPNNSVWFVPSKRSSPFFKVYLVRRRRLFGFLPASACHIKSTSSLVLLSEPPTHSCSVCRLESVTRSHPSRTAATSSCRLPRRAVGRPEQPRLIPREGVRLHLSSSLEVNTHSHTF
jgi:hypothetical protein